MNDKNLITTFFKRLKKPALNVLFIFLAWAATFILSVIAKLVFGEVSDSIMKYNPIINGFIHGDPSHLAMNLGLIFVFLIPEINQRFNFPKIFLITLIISVIYLPISFLFGIPAVGISGTLYFMLSRACLNKRNIFLYIFFVIMISPEIINIFNTSDGTAHTVHIIGSVLGFISLHLKNTNLNKYKLVQIIS
jgi:membrane associated rhomboid family serine protease